MHIKRLVLKNFQKIEDFDADFANAIYFIAGKNERGKSTIIKAIGMLLSGKPDKVLRNGAEKGFAKMTIGDENKSFDVDLKFSEANPNGTITITTESGMKSDKKSMLQEIFGYSDFDAVEFSRWSESAEGRRKQVEAVKSLLPVEVREKIEKIDTDIASTIEKRKDAARELKAANASFEVSKKDVSGFSVTDYEKPIDIKELLEQQKDFIELNNKAKTAQEGLELRTKQLNEDIPQAIKNAKENSKNRIQALKDQIKQAENDLKKDLETIDNQKQDFEKRKAAAEKFLSEYKEATKGQESIDDKINKSSEHNERYQKAKLYNERKNEFKQAEEKHEDLETSLKSLQSDRKKLVDESELPVKGLEFSDTGLTLNGIPFESGKVSDSQIMEVAVNLVIASNTKVKVFRISRGESLDEDRLQAIIDIAKKNGYQGFIEEVKRGQEELAIEEYTDAADEA